MLFFSSPVCTDDTLDPAKHMYQSPARFFTKTEEPYCDIGDKYISRIEEIFIGI